jgi:hypothetical protein
MDAMNIWSLFKSSHPIMWKYKMNIYIYLSNGFIYPFYGSLYLQPQSCAHWFTLFDLVEKFLSGM